MTRDSLFIFATATTTLVLGGLLTTTWTPAVSTEVLADAGIQPNFVATCNVRFAPDCLDDVQDAFDRMRRGEGVRRVIVFDG